MKNLSLFIFSRYIAYVLPQTFAVEATRGMLLRGWGLSYMPVYRGFLVTLAWIIATYAAFKKIVMKEPCLSNIHRIVEYKIIQNTVGIMSFQSKNFKIYI